MKTFFLLLLITFVSMCSGILVGEILYHYFKTDISAISGFLVTVLILSNLLICNIFKEV